MVCLDTSFIVDILRGNKEVTSILSKFDNLNISKSIPSPVLSEIFQGMHLSKDLKQEQDKIMQLMNSLEILSLTQESSILAGKISSNLLNSGQDIGLVDCMIAAIAITNNETLITRNLKHFGKIENLKIESY
ncbi:MAG: PIN domain-containing protein [Nanoarchaeota archaeon]